LNNYFEDKEKTSKVEPHLVTAQLTIVNIRLGWKWLAVENTPAYLITVALGFLVQATVPFRSISSLSHSSNLRVWMGHTEITN
jgi:hypothetical protein